MTDLEKVELAVRRAAETVGGPAHYLALQIATHLALISAEDAKAEKDKPRHRHAHELAQLQRRQKEVRT